MSADNADEYQILNSSDKEERIKYNTRSVKSRPPIHETRSTLKDIKQKKEDPKKRRSYSKSPNRFDCVDPDSEDEILSRSEDNLTETLQKDVKNKPKNTGAVIAVLVVLFFCVTLQLWFQKTSVHSDSTPINCSTLLKLSNKYPEVDVKIFKSLKASTEGLFNRNGHSVVFTFFSKQQNVLNALTEDVVKTTKACINQTLEPINLTSADLNRFSSDPTKIISEYSNELAKRTIMIINNLETVLPNILPALHSFTDTYNPLVKKSIIYFTVIVDDEPDGKPIDCIHKRLTKLLSNIEDNIKGALITRILDQSFYLKPFG